MASLLITLLFIAVVSGSAFYVDEPVKKSKTNCVDTIPKKDCEVLRHYQLCYTDPARKGCGKTCVDTCGEGCKDHFGEFMCSTSEIKQELCPKNRAYNIEGAFMACPKSCGLCTP
ncbi:uncharacterized protein LOC110232477 [Exaiptasia diaphana]|uniref:Uncharacterized protein n=1 Tax=Exaiptasia diaphana TaxID=2652724 RepID=A0A913WSA1_EXADI|nr:uncharacterized protein LOC110232477 [Exaiptasia diaphana]XP_020893338.1 uncharacterized protein LOC110232477 [Exaiptasia diaphana]KXJ18477.1 hypothetical protein AC249_AIPGENE27968 [Exaiptasia diaphana]